mmetsp:Transcript_34337/g.110271  ORF Transcript_34337/g.110271 Transcript_34337/m.110271 type:complete len:212 (+) Transcript_34337:916-1551(+)
MDLGTPTWSIDKFGSAVMTVRAEKSTRFPMRFPRRRPSLPFKRWRMVLRGLPERWVSCTPDLAPASLSKTAFTLYCKSSSNCWMTWGASPFFTYSPRVRFALTMETYWCVRSSSLLASPSASCTDGRTWGGGTGRTVTKSHSGRAWTASRPSILMASSEMFRKTWWHVAAERFCFRSPDPGTWSSSGENSTSIMTWPFFLKLGWGAPQPAS